MPETEKIGEEFRFEGVANSFGNFFRDIDSIIDKSPGDDGDEKAIAEKQGTVSTGLI